MKLNKITYRNSVAKTWQGMARGLCGDHWQQIFSAFGGSAAGRRCRTFTDEFDPASYIAAAFFVRKKAAAHTDSGNLLREIVHSILSRMGGSHALNIIMIRSGRLQRWKSLLIAI